MTHIAAEIGLRVIASRSELSHFSSVSNYKAGALSSRARADQCLDTPSTSKVGCLFLV